MRRLACLVLAFLALGTGPPALAQSGALTVYLDCADGSFQACDPDFFQREVDFVQYVRDRGAAELQVILTGEGTGGGGRRYQLLFVGREALQGRTDTLRYVAPQNASDDLVRRGVAQRLALGLVGFVRDRPLADRLQVTLASVPEGADGAEAGPPSDPWNGWVFSLSSGFFVNGESRQNRQSVNGNASARRTTDDLKLAFRVFGSYNRGFTQFSEDESFTFDSHSYGGNGRAVLSVAPQISAGVAASVSTSTFNNYVVDAAAGPSVEYSFFPYSETSQRQFRAVYTIEAVYADYREVTIYEQTEEFLVRHAAALAADFTQPWGSVDVALTGLTYLPDVSFYNVGLQGGVNLRVAGGLSVRLNGSASLVEDQLSLAAADPTDLEAIARQRQLATGYRYFASFNIRYTFGSVFNSVVNPRLEDVGGGGSVIFF